MKLEEVNQQTREAVDFLVAALESGHSAVLTQYLAAMAKFRNYSFGNIMLIARQKPDATNVAGFRAWNSLGRFVRRGEKGISILAPMISNRRKNNASEEQTEDANKSQPRLFGFRAVYVFDITQTEGKDLPTLTEVSGDASGYRERLVKFVETQGIVLSYSDRIAPAKGLSHGGRITLLCGMQPAEEFSTLTHEIAHLCGAGSYVALATGSASKQLVRPRRAPHNFRGTVDWWTEGSGQREAIFGVCRSMASLPQAKEVRKIGLLSWHKSNERNQRNSNCGGDSCRTGGTRGEEYWGIVCRNS